MSRSALDPRFVFRPATPQDAEAVMAVFSAAELADNGVVDTTLEDILGDWARPSLDLASDTLLALDGARIVAYADEFNQRAWVQVHPDARGRGIGTSLLEWTEQRARARGAQSVGQTLSETETAARQLLAAHGYVAKWDTWVFQLQLADDLPTPTPPVEGITLRTMQRPGDDRAVHDVIKTAFSDWPDRDPSETFEDWRASRLDRADVDPELIFVLEEDGQIVGAALCMQYEDEGWVDQLAVDRALRSRGLGSWLLTTAFVEFRRRGFLTAGLSTDSRTGARDLYERVGMRVVRSYARFGKQLG